MRMSFSLIVAGVLLLPVQATAQSGGAAGGASSGAATAPTGSPDVAIPGPPGTNSLGTAQSSGRGVTTGSAAGSTAEDRKIQEENREIERKLKGICKGC